MDLLCGRLHLANVSNRRIVVLFEFGKSSKAFDSRGLDKMTLNER